MANITSQIYDALKVANVEHSAFSTQGVNIFGDRKSIDAAKGWLDLNDRYRALMREIASTVNQTATGDHLHCKLALDRIAAIAKANT